MLELNSQACSGGEKYAFQDMEDYGDRLAYALSCRGKSRGDLASHLSISEQAVGFVINGQTKAFNAVNHSLTCQLLRIDPVWLAIGRGDAPAKDEREGLQGGAAVLAMEPAVQYATSPVVAVGNILARLSGYRKSSAVAVIKHLADHPETAKEAAEEIERIVQSESDARSKQTGT